MTTLAAPPPQSVLVTSEPTQVLAKRVNARGLCTTQPLSPDVDPWFPVTELDDQLVKQARIACQGCPVIAECRELALRMESRLTEPSIHGIFGALAPHERIALIRARRAGGAR